MIIPKMAYHEYVPSPDSMAAQIVDIKSAIKKKYVRATSRDARYPYKALPLESNYGDLKVVNKIKTNLLSSRYVFG